MHQTRHCCCTCTLQSGRAGSGRCRRSPSNCPRCTRLAWARTSIHSRIISGGKDSTRTSFRPLPPCPAGARANPGPWAGTWTWTRTWSSPLDVSPFLSLLGPNWEPGLFAFRFPQPLGRLGIFFHSPPFLLLTLPPFLFPLPSLGHLGWPHPETTPHCPARPSPLSHFSVIPSHHHG